MRAQDRVPPDEDETALGRTIQSVDTADNIREIHLTLAALTAPKILEKFIGYQPEEGFDLKTTAQVLDELGQAIADARAVTREAHEATKNLKIILKVEHDKAEAILRDEVRKQLAAVHDDVRRYFIAQADAVIADFREQLLGPMEAR